MYIYLVFIKLSLNIIVFENFGYNIKMLSLPPGPLLPTKIPATPISYPNALPATPPNVTDEKNTITTTPKNYLKSCGQNLTYTFQAHTF